jgi:hypothetical protein
VRNLPARAVWSAATVRKRRREPGPGSAAPPADPAGGTPLAPAWGWKLPHGGRVANVVPGAEFQATTHQCCGLNPFVTGAGSPSIGTPVGRDQLHGSVVCLDPLAWLRAGLVTNPGMFLLGEPGVGKALDERTLIPTPAGWTTMAALRPGDYVLGEDGHPVAVLATSEVMTGRPCLEIRFGDEAAIIADASHQWMTTATTAPACVPGGAPEPGAAETQIRTTQQIMDTVTGPGGEPAHSIAAARPLQLPAADLVIPPYLLGAWLAGDGTASIPATSRAICAAAAEAGYRPGRPDPRLRGQLRALELLSRVRIPGRYLRASGEQRRTLLDGLLASTGSGPGHGLIAYITSNAQLARDIRELACTLGHAAQLQRSPPARPGRDTWTVVIPAAPQWQVISVRPAASRPVRCIQVASPAGLFLAGESMVPTHNSALAKRLVTGAVARGETVLVLGDPRPDYSELTERFGGQVIRVGRGMARLNPLDSGPLGSVLPHLPAAEASSVRHEVRARRLSLLMALCTLIRTQPLGNAEEVMLGKAVDLLDERTRRQVTVPDVLRVIEEGPDELRPGPRAVPGPGQRTDLYPGPAADRHPARCVRRRDHHADRRGRADGVSGHLPRRRRR